MDVLKEKLNCTSTYVPAQLTKDKLLLRHIDALTKSNIKIDKLHLPTFYWLPKLLKNLYKSRFISNSSHCFTTILSKHVTSAITAVKYHAIKYICTINLHLAIVIWIISGPSKTLLKSSKSCVCETFRVLNIIFRFSTLYTSLGIFLKQEIWPVCMLDLLWVMWSFYFPHG